MCIVKHKLGGTTLMDLQIEIVRKEYHIIKYKIENNF